MGFPPYRNTSITEAGETGHIVRDIITTIEIEGVNSNYISFSSGGKTGGGSSSSTIKTTPIFPLPAGEYTTVLLVAVAGTDPMDYLVVQVSARQPGGSPFNLIEGPRQAVQGVAFYNWYIDGTDLKCRIWNGLEDLDARVWYV